MPHSLTPADILYYDLCVLVPAGALLMCQTARKDLWQIAICGWIVVSSFLVPMLAFASSKIFPLILESILTVLFIILLQRLIRHPVGNDRQPATSI